MKAAPKQEGDDEFAKELRLGFEALSQENIHHALKVGQKLVEARPESPQALSLLGRAFLEVGYYHKSMVTLRRAMSVEPENEEHLLLFIKVCSASGRTHKAMYETKKGLTQNPKSLALLLTSAQLHSKLNKTGKALKNYFAALRVASEQGGGKTAGLVIGAGPFEPAQLFEYLWGFIETDGHHLHVARCVSSLATRLGEHSKAEQAIEIGMKHHPNDAFLEAMAIQNLTAKGQLETAFEKAQVAVSRIPEFEEFHISLATVLWVAGRVDAAFNLCNALVAQQPSFLRTLDLAAQILLSVKRYREAVPILHTTARHLARDTVGQSAALTLPSEDFALPCEDLPIDLRSSPGLSLFFLPLLHLVIRTCRNVTFHVAKEHEALFQHVFPGHIVRDNEVDLLGPGIPHSEPLKLEHILPIALRDLWVSSDSTFRPLLFPSFRVDMAARRFGVARSERKIAIEGQVIERLRDQCSPSHSDFIDNVRDRLNVLLFTSDEQQVTEFEYPTTVVTFYEDLAPVLLNFKALIARRGPVAYLAASLGVPTWIVGADDGLPLWHFYNLENPSPIHPALYLLRGTEDVDFEEAVKQAVEGASSLTSD